jgi:hypothetical protein
MYKQLFSRPKTFTTNTFYANVHEMYKCDKNQMSYCNVKNFKKLNFWKFWAIDKTWPTYEISSSISHVNQPFILTDGIEL